MSLLEQYSSVMTPTFTPSRVFVHGQGVRLWDEAGKEYLDLLAGIACVSLGHANPGVTAAMADQAATLGHVSNLFATPPQIELATKLVSLIADEESDMCMAAPTWRVFLTNSGTESNEAGFKLTRMMGRTKVVAAEGSFHGRTMGALALTATEKYRQPFEPLPGDVVFVPYGDSEALAGAVDDQTAAIVLEPIQGESGVIVPPDGYLAAARAIADQHGALLWFDEVQSGMMRTGRWFAHTHERVIPDIVTMAKALGNGFPMGAVLASGRAAEFFTPGTHGTTFGGNALAARVACEVIDQLSVLKDHVCTTGDWLRDELSKQPGVGSVRGRGLFIGVQLEDPVAAQFSAVALDKGIIINAPRPNVLRLVPPLIMTQDDLGQLLDAWGSLMEEAYRG